MKRMLGALRVDWSLAITLGSMAKARLQANQRQCMKHTELSSTTSITKGYLIPSGDVENEQSLTGPQRFARSSNHPMTWHVRPFNHKPEISQLPKPILQPGLDKTDNITQGDGITGPDGQRILWKWGIGQLRHVWWIPPNISFAFLTSSLLSSFGMSSMTRDLYTYLWHVCVSNVCMQMLREAEVKILILSNRSSNRNFISL